MKCASASLRTFLATIGFIALAFPMLASAAPVPAPQAAPLPGDEPASPMACKGNMKACKDTSECCDALQCAWNPKKSANVCWQYKP
jgi:hypothetical protein